LTDVFGEYELVAESGLFDAAYYVATNPDVAAIRIDPLVHYLETGAAELRNPSESFDARRYAQLCLQRGEAVDNPLLHYIRRGAAHNLMPRVAGSAGDPRTLLLDLDYVRFESSDGKGRLVGVGWCLASQPMVRLVVSLGAAKARARYGLPRADVAAKYPQWLKSDHSGFEFELGPIADDHVGVVELEIEATTESGATFKKSVPVDLDAARAAADRTAAEGAAGPIRGVFSRPPMQLSIDAVEIDEEGILHIVGWAVCLAPVAEVQVLIDEQRFSAAEYGRPRDDVALSNPGYPNARQSGFELHADISSFDDGERVIKVQAIATTGITRETILPFTFAAARRGRAGRRDENKVQLFCDHIHVTESGQVSVSGWAVAAEPTERIAVLLDGNELGNAQLAIERPDVGNRFPQLAHARKAGFSFQGAVRPVARGEHLIVLRYCAGGDETDIPLPVLAAPGGAVEITASAPEGAAESNRLLSIDLPKIIDGKVVAPIRGNLEIAGWALAREGVDRVDILIDRQRLASVHTGIARPDVQTAFSGWEGALTAGFSSILPNRSMRSGEHVVTVALYDKAGQATESEFRIAVEEAPDADGPWALRRRMSPVEIDLLSRPLPGPGKRPSIAVLVPLDIGPKELERVRVTLRSLSSQVYDDWSVHLVAPSLKPAALRRTLLKDMDDLAGRVTLHGDAGTVAKLLAGRDAPSHFMVLRPGDELGCDAMLEFAVQAAMHPQADFFYCDDRRLSPASGKVEAFFKPQWSPDLLLSQNYIGRAWCADAALLKRVGFRPGEFLKSGSYELALRLTECATGVQHVPGTLLHLDEKAAEDSQAERKALTKALVRREISATVKAGRVRGTYRVQRKVTTRPLVSIIIPTCAARGLIRTCIESLRRLTRYKNYEIVCIENIPADKPDWKKWLRANADRVVETKEPFNWSRFNNLAVEASRGKVLVFLNDDTEVIDPDWLETLLESAQRPEVGVVGPQLLYPDRRVQHAGMFLANMGVARHAFRFSGEDEPGYFGLALTQRQAMAVTGACLMTRRETFKAVGGFDERHDVVNNDVDYCLRVWRRGLHTIYTPHTKLIHHELASRAEIADSYHSEAFDKEWRSLWVSGDPFFHPRLSRDRDDYSVDWEPTEVHCVGGPVLPHGSIRKILVVKLDHIGDCITALPAVRRLKQHFPDASLTVLSGRSSSAVWALEPAISGVIEFDFFNARSSSGLAEHSEDDWRELRERLASQRFDLAIDLRKHWETRPVLQQTSARYLAGFDMKGKFPWLDVALEWSEDRALVRKRQHTATDLVNLVDAVAAACEPDRQIITSMPKLTLQAGTARSVEFGRIFKKPVACIHASVGNEMRRWPAAYFSLLIDQLVEAEGMHVVLVGGPDETAIGDEVLAAVRQRRAVWSLIGKLKLNELPAVIARCTLFVGNNSGPHHIAAGLGVPTVGIHSGVVDAREWGPNGSTAVAIDRVMACSPCYLSKVDDCGRELACMRGLLPGDVMTVCRRLLAKARVATDALR
jgi:O-antigen biosynthesis protein